MKDEEMMPRVDLVELVAEEVMHHHSYRKEC